MSMPAPIYDEALVPNYTLPNPLLDNRGQSVSATNWHTHRRAEILAQFSQSVYGKTPPDKLSLDFEIRSASTEALAGKATRKEVAITCSNGSDKATLNLLIYLPQATVKPVPVFVGLNFNGNHTIHLDPAITLSTHWVPNKPELNISDNRATELSRGAAASRWAIEQIIGRGYGLATCYSGDLDPDYDDGFQNGIHPLFYQPGQIKPSNDQWGTIGAWAWGLSRALDYFETDANIDHNRIVVMGHSRLGKAALWAGAQDERFAAVISNNSGCGGAALSRRAFGETVAAINTRFPHWFCHNFKQFDHNEASLPVDQHMLIALIAPRPIYIASAAEDLWADPHGEFLAAKAADPVYRLLGTDGLVAREMPAPNQPALGTISYHVRTGGHDVTLYDWEQYLNFADQHL